jgi:hypothetical protein
MKGKEIQEEKKRKIRFSIDRYIKSILFKENTKI